MVVIRPVMEGKVYWTAKTIRQFIRSPTAKEWMGWFTGKHLDEILNGKRKVYLKEIQQEFENIKKKTLMKITVETEWEHKHTRLFKAEMDICHKFQLLQTILTSGESKNSIINEVKQLQNGILNTNNGVLSNMSVIHQELVGQTVNSTNKGLLATWYESVCNNMIENPMSAKTCYENVIKHLDKFAILQFKGFLLFLGANENSKFCTAHLEYFENNLKCQSELMDKTISNHMKYLTRPNRKNVFYLRPVSDARFEPFVKRQDKQKPLIYEYNLEHIEEEKWTFEESTKFKENGSLFISGLSSKKNHDERSYMSVKNEKKAICVSLNDKPQPFFVMPLGEKTSTKIIICKFQPESQVDDFLGHYLKFTDNKENIQFTMTKVDDIKKTEHKWDIFFSFKKFLRTFCQQFST